MSDRPSNEVENMDGWDFVIFSGALYLALVTLVRLMRTRWELRHAMLWFEYHTNTHSKKTQTKQPPKQQSSQPNTDESEAA